MKFKTEEIVEPVVKQFVKDLNGRYREHTSDMFLAAVLMRRLSEPVSPYRHEVSRAEALLSGDHNTAYDAACCVFETMLEHKCRAGGNGHHVAQDFSAAMNTLLPAEKTEEAPPAEEEKWLRVRFHADGDDYRAVKWPPPGPYWCSGMGEGYSIVVAYVRSLGQVEEFWPEASDIDVMQENTDITFSERFAQPDWWPLVADEQAADSEQPATPEQ